MRFRSLVETNRSYRRFHESRRIPMADLVALVDLARLTASARNLQALRFSLVSSVDMCESVFPTLGWAGYLPRWKGPEPGERPAAYIVIAVDRDLTSEDWGDHGIAAQTILLGAVEKGYGGCMLGSVNRERLAVVLGLPDSHEILLVLALGVPAETVVVDPLPDDGDVRYWRDSAGVHHVPKRELESLITVRFCDETTTE
ncbi:nitroreductase family protein [Pseudodesulfovibrio senegalensis]|uniref:Nitroreductase family protein n=1 Tax=Pseudodesulfovibrio senegalensis TaxID=1721087 RepID=A0A6N6N0V1_9BACT|nr:nitroreductase family protein [Pseudodesulfovibrio senegalensis]